MALKYESFTTMHSKTDQVVTVVLDHASLALHTNKNVAVAISLTLLNKIGVVIVVLLKTTQGQDYFGIATLPTTLV